MEKKYSVKYWAKRIPQISKLRLIIKGNLVEEYEEEQQEELEDDEICTHTDRRREGSKLDQGNAENSNIFWKTLVIVI